MTPLGSGRLWFIALALICLAVGMTVKLLSLFTEEQAFLRGQGDARSIRNVSIPATRGAIYDRNGELIAASAPVYTIWADPKYLEFELHSLKALARILDEPSEGLSERLMKYPDRRFVYIKRQVSPDLAKAVRKLAIPGIYIDHESKRFYPAGEVVGHVTGFTNMEDEGQEGLELAYNAWLNADSGHKKVLKDRTGRTIRVLGIEQEPKHGKDLQLTLDLRMQYLAYRELKAAFEVHQADSASAVLLDAKTGEVLSMVNQPAFNPNDRANWEIASLRNRAMTDIFEPGSTMKPITIAAAMMSGQHTKGSIIDTSPGHIRVKGAFIRDHRNYGELDLTGIITKSSNVGVTKITLSIEPYDAVRTLMSKLGLGQVTSSGFPGERTGDLPYLYEKQVVERATQSYGYGLSVTALQLAQSYLAFANKGMQRPVSLVKLDNLEPGVRVMPESVATSVLEMMETVTGAKGTGQQARVLGYRVAGKTGTAHKAVSGGYSQDHYISVFAGIAPVSDPEFVLVVMVDHPKGQEYFGGEVAAPVFSRIMTGALRMRNVPMDDLESVYTDKKKRVNPGMGLFHQPREVLR